MQTITKTISWTSKNCGIITATLTVKRGYNYYNETVNLDGDLIDTAKKEIIESKKWSVSAAGKTFNNCNLHTDSRYTNGLAAVLIKYATTIGIYDAKVADKLVLAESDAKKEAENNVEWIEIAAQRAANDKLEREYQEHVEAVERAL